MTLSGFTATLIALEPLQSDNNQRTRLITNLQSFARLIDIGMKSMKTWSNMHGEQCEILAPSHGKTSVQICTKRQLEISYSSPNLIP